MRVLAVGAALLLAQAGCAGVAPRSPRHAREIAVVAATSAPRVSVAREDPPADLMTYWVAALVYPPFAADAARGTAQFVGDVRRALTLRTHAGPELHGQLADAVLSAAAGGARLVRADAADDEGCGAAVGTQALARETLHVAVTSVAWVPAAGPDAPLALSVAVRGVLRGPDGCAERTLLLASSAERPLEGWYAGDARELDAELRTRIAEAGTRIASELVARDEARR